MGRVGVRASPSGEATRVAWGGKVRARMGRCLLFGGTLPAVLAVKRANGKMGARPGSAEKQWVFQSRGKRVSAVVNQKASRYA